MKIIMLESHKGLDSIGKSMEVRDGYAANYLIPNKLAVPAFKSNANRPVDSAGNAHINQIANKIPKFLLLKREVKANGDLYLEIKETEVVQLLKKFGIKVWRSQILFVNKIKRTGTYKISVLLAIGTNLNTKLVVERSNGYSKS